jgi:hypothetical protein
MGVGENSFWHPALLGDCAPSSGTAGFGSRLDRPFRLDLSLTLRQLSPDRAVLASVRRYGAADHVEANFVEESQRVLGEALESRVPATGLRFNFPAAAQTNRRGRGELAGVSSFWPDPRSCHIVARTWWIRPSHRLLRRARPGRHAGTFQIRETGWFAERVGRMVVPVRSDCWSGFLAFSSCFRAARDSPVHVSGARPMKKL